MDAKTKAEAAGLGAKIITNLLIILPPIIIANITHWAASVLTEKKISLRVRIAIFLGSFGLASVVHWIFGYCGWTKWEWVFIWSTSMGTQQLLNFFYLEWGDILKNWIKNQMKQGLKALDKKP